MLFLRRTVGESIVLFDRRTRCEINVLRVDPESRTIEITISGFDAPIILRKGQRIKFLQGDGLLVFKTIFVYDRYPSAASLGISAPRSMAIYRAELLTGLGPDQIEALQR